MMLPHTFSAWYRRASEELGRAEQVDLSLARILGGFALVILQFICLLPVANFVLSALAVPTPRPSYQVLAVAILFLCLVWVCWLWYRRRWNAAWRRRTEWSLAIYDPAVLDLAEQQDSTPSERDLDADPESAHPYRARNFYSIENRPFTDRVLTRGYVYTDRARPREALRGFLYLIAFVMFVLILPVTAAGPQDLRITPGTALAATFAILPPLVSAWFRYGRRIRFAQKLARLESRDRQRWLGWQMLQHRGSKEGRRPGAAEVESCRLLDIQVIAADLPPLGSTAVPPGSWTLEVRSGGRSRFISRNSDEIIDANVTAVVGGYHQGNWRGHTRSHWLFLSDKTHIPIECFAESVIDMAETIGIDMVRPPMTV